MSDPTHTDDDTSATHASLHTVRKGESLSTIAEAHYGDARHWRDILDANRDQLDDPDRIAPGQVLRLPTLGDHPGAP